MTDKLIIFDTTLRDGEQSPGASMTKDEKLRIARQLERLKVDVIEAGFAASSNGDFDCVHAIANTIKDSTVCSLARANDRDIARAAEALKGANSARIHTFIATSPLHMEKKLRMTPEQVLEQAIQSVRFARNLCADIEFSPEDGYRSDPDFLCRVLEAVIKEGATTLNIPDTVGYAIPELYGEFIRSLRERVPNSDKAIWSVHCHNDLGMAVANTLAAIEGGAMQVECTVNGIGERAGNCALEELVMALKVRSEVYGCDTSVDSRRLVPTSRLLTRLTGMQVQRNKAIVGANAFAHESGIHQHGMLRHRDTYEIIRPEDVGVDRSQMVLGRHSGRAALIERLAFLGYTLDDAALGTLFAQFKTLAEKKKEVFDADLEALLASDDGQSIDGWRLKAFHISTGAGEGTRPAAAVEIRDASGTALRGRATGDGPVHALFEALAAATGTAFMIESYQVGSVSTGEDALGQASVITLIDDEEINGAGTSTDILEASALAWLDVANRLARRERSRITQVADRARVATA